MNTKMNFGKIATFIIFLLVTLLIYFTSNSCKDEHFENQNLKWNRNKCKYILGNTLEDELKSNNIEHSSDSWDLYFPCGYDDITQEINEMKIQPGAKYFIIEGCDELVAKEWLWTNVKNHYGRNYAQILLPTSYVLYNPSDLILFNKEFDQSKVYIMKKNIQRQEGLKITNDKKEILNGVKNQYVLVQELLQNPYLISGLKTNMRFYVLVVCNHDELKVYVHNDGFMYYTKVPFCNNSLKVEPNITTGYIDRKVYDTNPLTHDDLRQYLDNPTRQNLLSVEKSIRSQQMKISQVCFERIYNTLRTIFISFVGKICKPSKLSQNISFQLFGVDVAVDNELNCKIIEINKGPDMGAKDKRDSELKHGVMQDILTLIKVTNNENKRQPKFLKILDVKHGVINTHG